MRISGRNRTLLSKPARTFYKDALIFLSSAGDPTDEEVSVIMEFYSPHYQPYDVDNRIKAVLDAMTKAGVWYDDRQVVEITARKMTNPAKLALVVIHVEPYEIEANDSKT